MNLPGVANPPFRPGAPTCKKGAEGSLSASLRSSLRYELRLGTPSPLAAKSEDCRAEAQAKAAMFVTPVNQPNFYVYILQSLSDPNRYYAGFTENIQQRLTEHNAGKSVHTKQPRPWRIKTGVAFSDREQALRFERYLKTSSGRAFAKKRL